MFDHFVRLVFEWFRPSRLETEKPPLATRICNLYFISSMEPSIYNNHGKSFGIINLLLFSVKSSLKSIFFGGGKLGD